MKRFLCVMALVLASLCGSASATEIDTELANMAYAAYSCSASYWTDATYMKWSAEDAKAQAYFLDDWWVSLGNDSILDEILSDPSSYFYPYYALIQLRETTAVSSFNLGLEWHNQGQAFLLLADSTYYAHQGHGGYIYVVGTGGSYTYVWDDNAYCPPDTDCAQICNSNWVMAMAKCGGTDWPIWRGFGVPNGDLSYGAAGAFWDAFSDYNDIQLFWSAVCDYLYNEMNVT